MKVKSSPLYSEPFFKYTFMIDSFNTIVWTKINGLHNTWHPSKPIDVYYCSHSTQIMYTKTQYMILFSGL